MPVCLYACISVCLYVCMSLILVESDMLLVYSGGFLRPPVRLCPVWSDVNNTLALKAQGDTHTQPHNQTSTHNVCINHKYTRTH